MQLFVDRAQAVRHDFALSDDNALAVVEICRRLDGLPLGIELAAARTRLLEPRALLARLGSRLDALGTGPVDLPERQRTLRATVEWSIGLLGEAERHMLATLSIFVDGWTVEAAVRVADLAEDRTLDLLDALAGHSLVSVEATRRRAEVPHARSDPRAGRRAPGSPARTWPTSSGATRSTSARSSRTPSWPAENAVRVGRSIAHGGRQPRQSRSAGSSTHDIAPLPHVFRILWLFWQMRDRMPEGRAWIRELLLRSEELDDRARSRAVVDLGRDRGRGR